MDAVAPLRALVALVLAAGSAGGAAGQGAPAGDGGPDLGRIEYLAGCAQCHGLAGRGDGVIAGYLTVAPPDLTAIARTNGGLFPAGVIYEIIEGANPVGAHGTRQMPAWGDRYSVDAHLLMGGPLEPEDRDAFVRSRILALVEYLASIQE